MRFRHFFITSTLQISLIGKLEITEIQIQPFLFREKCNKINK